MAHEIEYREGRYNFAYVGDLPWHGLGKSVSNDLSPKEMMEVAGVDWAVEKRPMYFRDARTNEEVSVGKPALVRDIDNKVLTVISDGWEPVQNESAFEFFKEFVDEGHMEMHTAGSLKGGKIVFALAKVNDGFDLFSGKDVVESHLLFSNPHEYGKSVDIRFTPIRVVCANTLALALNDRSSRNDLQIKLNHRSVFNPEIVKETLGIAKSKLNIYKEKAEFLSLRPATKAQIVDYLQRLFPATKDKVREDENVFSKPASIIHSVMDTQPGAEFGRGTWWQAFNAVTYSVDHLLGRRNDTRMESSWYGVNRVKKEKALELALEMSS